MDDQMEKDFQSADDEMLDELIREMSPVKSNEEEEFLLDDLIREFSSKPEPEPLLAVEEDSDAIPDAPEAPAEDVTEELIPEEEQIPEEDTPEDEMPVEEVPAEEAPEADVDEMPAEENKQMPQEETPEVILPKEHKRKKPFPVGRAVVSYLHDVVYLLAIILFLLLMVFRIVIVEGPSMKNTLLNGDYILLLSNVFYQEPKQGDIVVACKESFEDGEPIIKRVIATEGQQVDIDFDKGVVIVDGKELSEPYTLTPTTLYEGVNFPLTVDEGCVFVMGDNRNRSKDSRSPEIGLIDERELLGKALVLLFPGFDSDHPTRDYDRIGGLQ